MSFDDEDLFDPPAPKKSTNKIVFQPAGAQWSLDRLPEVESLYQSTFNKRLPLANRGQGSIHNRWGYDHRNSADVSLNPATPEGQQFTEQLKKANIPFLAFTGAVPGVATGPHIHIGFPSQRTQQKFKVGTQKNSTATASDDLFDTSDDDLFDSEQTPPSKAATQQPTTGQSAPSITQALDVLTQSTNAATRKLSRALQQGAPSRLSQLRAKYPWMQNLDVNLIDSTAKGDPNRKLEFYPADETDNPQSGKPTIEVFSKDMKDSDLMGEVLSHYLPSTDKQVADFRRQIIESMTPLQRESIRGDYEQERKSGLTTDSFDAWLSKQGGDSFFRGYPTGQWSANEYTRQQKRIYAQLQSYLNRNSASAPTVPEGLLLPQGRRNYNLPQLPTGHFGKPYQPPIEGKRGELLRQMGQQRTIDEQQRTQQQQAENEARTELQSERLLPNYPGIPSGRGVLKLISDPVGKFGEALKSDEQIVQERAQQILHQQQVAQQPEVTSIRKEYGAMPAAVRSVAAPVIGRGSSGLLKVAGGVASAFGIAPNKLSDWANKRAEIIEAGSTLPPLREQQNLGSLITGKPQLEEIERGIPEKVATGIADLGVGIGQIILLKKATGLSFPKLLALEAAAKANDKPASEQLARAGEGYVLGRALDSHLGRAATAGLFGIPTAAQTGYEVSQGRMSPLDAAIQTGIQAGAGAILTPGKEPSSLELGLAREPVRERVEPGADIAAKLRGETTNEPQTKVQPDVETQRTEVGSEGSGGGNSAGDVRSKSELSNVGRVGEGPREGAVKESVSPTRFYHRDYGEVTESPNQQGVSKRKVRVVAEDGSEHVIKKAAMTGAGNQRAVPIRETEPSAQPPEPATPKEEVRPPSPSVTEPVAETAVKNAAMEADRAARDLPELVQAEPRRATEVHQRALDANQRDPRSPDRLVQQALSSDKNFTDVETAQLRLRAQEIKNREQDLLSEIDSATDPQVIRDKRVELDSLTEEFDRLSQATKKAGTEWGRAGVARQQAIDQDFSLVSMKARLKAAKGEQLTEAENAQVEDLYRRNAELESKLAEANDKLAQRRLQSEIDRTSRRERRAQTKQSLDDEFAQLKQQFAQARAEVRNVQPSGLAAFDPEGKLTKLIGKMARNRIQAGVTDAAQLVDDIHAVIAEHLPDVSKRDVRDAISGYSIGPKSRRSELQRQIDALKSELRSVSKGEDIAAGKRAPTQEGPQKVFRRDQARQRAIQKQIADLESQMRSGNFRDKPPREPARYTKETYQLQKQLDEVRLEYERMKYRATASPATRFGHEAVKVVNALKTLKSIGDVSAMLRQGGFYGISHPIEGLLKPTREMIKSFTDMGYRNVEAAIKADPAYDTLKHAGVEFTGVERNNPHLSVREEGYLGGEYLNYIPGVKQVKDFSERTFVSFLDAQRLLIGKQMIEGLPEDVRNNPQELKAIAKLINAGTGRGNLGKKGNQAAPLLNLAIFSPRLLVSRIQLLNNMISPRKLATMPPGARSRMVKDNVKFVAATMAALGLAKAAGMSVNLNPNDADFLKIRAGNTTYDTLTGLQQPLRYLINMGRAVEADITGNEKYSGRSKAELSGRFARSKLSPAAGIGLDYILGKDYMGKPFSLKNEAKEAVMPLPAKDVIEAMQNEGLWGGVKALPTFTGIGVSNYPYKPYVNKKVQRLGLESDVSDVREGRKSAYELNEMVERGEITGAQRKQILNDAKVSEKQARFSNYPATTALDRFERMDAAAQDDVRDLMEKKAYNLLHSDILTDQQKADFQERLDKLGITPQAPSKSNSSFKDLFKQRTASPF